MSTATDTCCPHCSLPVAGHAVDPRMATLRCLECARDFPIVQTAPYPAAEKPKDVVIEDHGARRILRRRWSSSATPVYAIASLFWNGMVWFFMGKNVVNGIVQASRGHFIGWGMLLFSLLFILVGLAFAYCTLVQLFNRTLFEVNGDRFCVRHGPLPWKGNLKMDVARIESVTVVQVSEGRGQGSNPWRLVARLADGKELVLVNGLASEGQAFWVQQTLDGWLAPARGKRTYGIGEDPDPDADDGDPGSVDGD